jgi:putative tricarboxylic transport membrane protein
MLRGLRADTLTSALALGIASYIIHQGLDLEVGTTSNPGSGFILFWTGLMMAILSAIVLVQSLLPTADRTSIGACFADIRWGKVLYVLGLLVAYTTVLDLLGFIVATGILLVILFKTVEPQSWKVAILGSVLTTGCAWLVFVHWLGTQLPVGSLFEAG